MPGPNNRSNDILIAGGGIGGLAAALALAQSGVSSTVFEQAREFGEIGAGIQLAPNAFQALDMLGVRDGILDGAVFIDGLIMMDLVSDEVVADIPVKDAFRERFGNPYAVIHRRDLLDALLDGCRRNDRVRLIAGARIIDFRQTEERVIAIAESGERYEGAGLVGADGLRSNIREHIIGDGEPAVSGHVSYRAVLPVEEMPEELRWNAATLWGGPNTHLVHYPLRSFELFNIVITFHSKQEEHGVMNEAGSRDEVMEYFSGFAERPLRILEKPKEWRRWSLCYRDPVENWTRGRATLLGDAAHPMLQYFAQGACMALEDAVCLARCVAATDGDLARAFVDYQNARLVRTGRVALSAMMLGHFFHASSGARLVRNGTFQKRTPDEFYDGLAWLYGGPDQ